MGTLTGISRRVFLQGGALALGGVALSAVVGGAPNDFAASPTQEKNKATVFFTKDLSEAAACKTPDSTLPDGCKK